MGEVSAGKLRVVVVDDSEVVRAKMRALLGSDQSFDLVGEAENGESGVEIAKELQPDLVVMDLRMPGMSGIEAIWQLGTASPSSRVLVLTVSAEQEDVADAIIAGANGYVVKGANDEEITNALRGVAAGKRVISRQVASKLVDRVGTERERRLTTPSPAAPSAPRVPTPSPRDPALAEEAEVDVPREDEPEERAPARRAARDRRPDPRPQPPPEPEPLLSTGETAALVLAIALVAAIVLTSIWQGQAIIDGNTTSDTWIKAGLNFVVALAAVSIGVVVGRYRG